MGDKVIKKKVNQHPSNEKTMAAKANAAKAAAVVVTAAKPSAKPTKGSK